MLKFITLGLAPQCGAIPKCMPLPAAVTAGLVTGGFSLGNSILGAWSQNQSNKSYLKGVQETNATNLRIAQETNDLNRQLYERNVKDNRINASMQNAYDSPSAQLSRLRQAGINAYLSQNGVQIQSATPSPAVGATMHAPSQIPNPLGNLNLGGAASEFLSSYQSVQNMQDKAMDLYMKGIDTQYYLTKTINEIDMQLLDISQKHVLTEQDREKLAMLQDERKQYSEQLSLQRQLNQENIAKIQNENKEIQSRILRDDALALATIGHWSKQDLIAEFEAMTGRQLAYIQNKHVDGIIDQMNNNIRQEWMKLRQGWKNIDIQREVNSIKKQYLALDKDEKLLCKRLMEQELLQNYSEYEFMLQEKNSPLNWFLRNTLGINSRDIISGASSAGAAFVGARLGRVPKNPYGNNASYSR